MIAKFDVTFPFSLVSEIVQVSISCPSISIISVLMSVINYCCNYVIKCMRQINARLYASIIESQGFPFVRASGIIMAFKNIESSE